MRWAIFNAAGYRWGSEAYASELAARTELRRFFKGHKVDFAKFYIEQLEDEAEAAEVQTLPRLTRAG